MCVCVTILCIKHLIKVISCFFSISGCLLQKQSRPRWKCWLSTAAKENDHHWIGPKLYLELEETITVSLSTQRLSLFYYVRWLHFKITFFYKTYYIKKNCIQFINIAFDLKLLLYIIIIFNNVDKWANLGSFILLLTCKCYVIS